MDNNNTWFKVQNVSLVSSRKNRTHAGKRASIDRSQSGDKALAGFRCGELAKVAPLYKKALRKRRQAAEAMRNGSIKRARGNAIAEKTRKFVPKNSDLPFFLFLHIHLLQNIFTIIKNSIVRMSFLNKKKVDSNSSGE